MSRISSELLTESYPVLEQYQALYQASNPSESWFVGAQSSESQGVGVLIRPEALQLGGLVIGYTAATARETPPTIVASEPLEDTESIQKVAEQLTGNLDIVWAKIMKGFAKDLTTGCNTSSAGTPLMQVLGNRAARAYFGDSFPQSKDALKMSDQEVANEAAERIAKKETLSAQFNRKSDPDNPKITANLYKRVKNKSTGRAEHHTLPAEYDWLNIVSDRVNYKLVELESIGDAAVTFKAALGENDLTEVAQNTAKIVTSTMERFAKGKIHIGQFLRNERTDKQGNSYVGGSIVTYIDGNRHAFYIDRKDLERAYPNPEEFRDAYFAFRIAKSREVESNVEGALNLAHTCKPITLEHPDAMKYYSYGNRKRGPYFARMARVEPNVQKYSDVRTKRDDSLMTVATPINSLFVSSLLSK